MKFVAAVLIISLLAGGCLAERPAVRISSVHIDRAAIILAKQGMEESDTVMDKIAGAIVPLAEVVAVASQPLAGLAIIGGHVAIALTEKGGDVGGDRFVAEVSRGTPKKLSITFNDERALGSIVLEMSEDGTGGEPPQ